MGMYIVVTGDPVDGLVFFGPFTTGIEATEWAENTVAPNEWWIAPLAAQTEY